MPGWRAPVGLGAAAGGAVLITGACLPWVTTFAGLINIPGIRGSNGRILAAAGVVIAVAGLWHAVRGGPWSRWLAGLAGFAATGFCGFLLLQLAASLRSLSTDSMVAARSGPGLWVGTAGALLAFGTLFLPASTQQTLIRRRPGRGLVAWAADPDSTGVRRGIQIALGVLWLADGALQLQPVMFTRNFVTQTLMPATMGSPAGVSGPVLAFSKLVLHDPAGWDAAFAVTQLLLGAGLLWRRSVRAALAASIGWALAVWWLGESLGGVLSGTASPLTGAPGAVILYALLAVLAWPRHGTGHAADSVAAGSPLRRRGSQLAWLLLWSSSAFFLLQPANRTPHAIPNASAGLAAAEPGWLAGVDRAVAGAVGSHSPAVTIGLAVACLVIAAGILSRATTRAALLLSVLVALVIWVLGENFGGLLTGQATDPNTGPLLILLAVAYGHVRLPGWVRKLSRRSASSAIPRRSVRVGERNSSIAGSQLPMRAERSGSRSRRSMPLSSPRQLTGSSPASVLATAGSWSRRRAMLWSAGCTCSGTRTRSSRTGARSAGCRPSRRSAARESALP